MSERDSARGGPRAAPPKVGGLGVIVDGQPMPPDEAREFWGRFSAHMEDNKGDLAGFAKREGYASVHPAMREGRGGSRRQPHVGAASVRLGGAGRRGLRVDLRTIGLHPAIQRRRAAGAANGRKGGNE